MLSWLSRVPERSDRGRYCHQMADQDHGLAEALAKVSRALQSEDSAQETLQKIVELAVATIGGCDHAGITIMNGRVYTPAATGEVPRQVVSR